MKMSWEEFFAMVKEKGGEINFEDFDKKSKSKKRLKWKCADGHIWEATLDSVKQGSWCPYCARKKVADNRRDDVEEMQRIAKERGGECLSAKYINAKEKLKWKCSEGHEWKAPASSVKRGSWCPACSGKQRLTMKKMKKIAKERGGECLSKNYINSKTKLKWKCSEGHEWEATPDSIKRNTWCPNCVGRLTIEDMQKIAKERGGECLSKKYKGSRTKLRWKCQSGHIWEETPFVIKTGMWCPKDAGKIKIRRQK